MLFNKSTGKPDILSLGSLIAWLEQQPVDGGYNYCSASNCLLNQYFTAMGLEGVLVTPSFCITNIRTIDEKWLRLPSGWDFIAIGSTPFNGIMRTYGKALERAKALQKASVQ